MTVSELFKKNDFESILPHLNHLFMVNSGRHFSDASIEVFRGLYKNGPSAKQSQRIAISGLFLVGSTPVHPST